MPGILCIWTVAKAGTAGGALPCCTSSMMLGCTCTLSGANCMQADMRGQAAPADLPISSRKLLEVSLLLAVGMWVSTFGNRCCPSGFRAWDILRCPARG